MPLTLTASLRRGPPVSAVIGDVHARPSLTHGDSPSTSSSGSLPCDTRQWSNPKGFQQLKSGYMAILSSWRFSPPVLRSSNSNKETCSSRFPPVDPWTGWIASCYCRADRMRQLKIPRYGKQLLSQHNLPLIQIRRRAKHRISASGVASVPAEEESIDNSAGGGASESVSGSGSGNGSSGVKLKTSGQLARWARARKIRAGKTTTLQKKTESSTNVAVQDAPEQQQLPETETVGGGDADEEYSVGEEYGSLPPLEGYGKCVYMISDGTGWTVDNSVHAALGQFEHCMVDRRCSVATHLFSDVNDVDRLMEIIRGAGLEGGMIVYTIADPAIAVEAKHACEMLRIPHIDLLGPVTDALANHLGVSPSGLPRGASGRGIGLSQQYFKRIDAVEFTIKQDDGALPKNLRLADIVLAGVSRTSKTPLSTYIAQKGYKVANVPLVYGIDPPKELFEIDQDKVFGLTINANFLKAIRLNRYRHLGVAENSRSSYSDMEHIRRELEYSRKLFSQNPRWPVVEVTGKAIEETAAVILRLYHERRNKYSMPRISTRY